MNKQVREVIDNETPHIVCEFGNYELRVYWCGKSGMYGWQCMTVVFKDHSFHGHYKTGGCGFCKTSEAVEQGFRMSGKMPKGYAHGGGTYGIPYKYHIGGNYSKVPVKDLRKWRH